MQCHCMMGLFPEINRAWLTIDSDIYLWTFEDGGDVAYYDGLNETILSVGLIKPKHAVFQNFVKHLLVLATAVDIVVLGVTFTSDEDDAMKEIQLFSDPVFSIPTDGSLVTTIVGTNSGRLFYGSKDVMRALTLTRRKLVHTERHIILYAKFMECILRCKQIY